MHTIETAYAIIMMLNQTFTTKKNTITPKLKHPYINIYHGNTKINGSI